MRTTAFEDLQYRKDKSLVLHWKEMIAILRENGKEIGDLEDIEYEVIMIHRMKFTGGQHRHYSHDY